MARLVEWHDDHARDAECVRFRSAVRRRRLREWLRRVPCRCQRPVLLRPAEEKILVGRNNLPENSKAQEISVARRSVLRKNRRLPRAEVISAVAEAALSEVEWACRLHPLHQAADMAASTIF